jgi:nitrogenase molybdenum-iron protein alpha/beta subunit
MRRGLQTEQKPVAKFQTVIESLNADPLIVASDYQGSDTSLLVKMGSNPLLSRHSELRDQTHGLRGCLMTDVFRGAYSVER